MGDGEVALSFCRSLVEQAEAQKIESTAHFSEDGCVNIEISGDDPCRVAAFEAAVLSWINDQGSEYIAYA